jgi:hypothetical protein
MQVGYLRKEGGLLEWESGRSVFTLAGERIVSLHLSCRACGEVDGTVAGDLRSGMELRFVCRVLSRGALIGC